MMAAIRKYMLPLILLLAACAAQGQTIDRYTPSEDQSRSGQKGRRVGIAYELENGEIIYVPE